MAGNSAFELVTERGWRRGLRNLLANEIARWTKTKTWWVQFLIWSGIIGFMLGGVMFASKGFALADGVALYAVFATIVPAVGVIISMQGVLVGEKSVGTAAWVLSKPASRPAFILAKLLGSSLRVLVTMVLLPGVVAFVIFETKTAMNPVSFLAAAGIIFLSLLPALRYVLPWTLSIPLNNLNEALVPNLLLGQPVDSYLPILIIAAECLLFVLVAIWRFNREEL